MNNNKKKDKNIFIKIKVESFYVLVKRAEEQISYYLKIEETRKLTLKRLGFQRILKY